MDKKKRIVLISLSIAVLVLIVVAAMSNGQEAPTPSQPLQSGSNAPAETIEMPDRPADPEMESAPGTDGVTEPSGETNWVPPQTQETFPDTQTDSPAPPPEVTGDHITLPYTIQGSSLVIEQINPYEGIFLEDGSDEEVSAVAAIVLRNTGDTCVEYASILLEQDGVQLHFTASALAPGSAAIVAEAERKPFRDGAYTKCTAEISEVAELEMSQDQIRLEEVDGDGIQITNISGADIPCIRIFYKFYMSDADAFVGGITYTAKVVDLKAGEACVVRPSHYMKEYSRIVMVKTYDTAE